MYDLDAHTQVQRVDDTIAELGLSVCEHTPIGNVLIRGVSGGQRRRVSIGCELVTAPTVLFLDEPTSGLDAASAYHVMNVVRHLANRNRTILSVIHQPSSEVFELFDKLYLLSAGATKPPTTTRRPPTRSICRQIKILCAMHAACACARWGSLQSTWLPHAPRLLLLRLPDARSASRVLA